MSKKTATWEQVGDTMHDTIRNGSVRAEKGGYEKSGAVHYKICATSSCGTMIRLAKIKADYGDELITKRRERKPFITKWELYAKKDAIVQHFRKLEGRVISFKLIQLVTDNPRAPQLYVAENLDGEFVLNAERIKSLQDPLKELSVPFSRS